MTRRRKRDVVREIFGLRPRTPQGQPPNSISEAGPATQDPPLPPPTANVDSEPTIPNAQPVLQSSNIQPNKVFTRGESFKRDMASLSIAYLLQESPELKSLIQLIIVIRDNDPDGQLTAVLESCARFAVQLASALDAHRAEVTQAITKFEETVEKLNTTQFNGSGNSIDELTSTIQNDIDNIKPSFIGVDEIETGERLSKVLDVTIGPAVDILNLVKIASSLIPVPWVQPLIGTVTSMLQAVSQTRANYSEMRQIAATAGNFVVSCAVICAGSTVGTTLESSLKKFNKTLQFIAEDCDKLRHLSLFSRYLQQSNHMGDLQGIRKRLDEAIQLFQTENSINIKLDTEELTRKIDLASLAILPSHPRYTRNEYLEKSRDDVLEYLSDWISNAQESVLWMHGAAGLGKSTVAQELVSLLKSEDRLAGGVFLTNLATEPPETVVQMISRQLGEMYPRAVAQIAEAARKLQGPHSSLREYFAGYILDPIRVLNYPYPLVIVVDGLDEWKNSESFLAELVHISSPSPVKFVLSSRFNYSIERAVTKLPSLIYPLPLASQQIIERYFHYHFSSDDVNWRGRKPDDARISRLAARADGLLVWAATARLSILNKFAPRNPHEILDEILFSEEKAVNRADGPQERRLERLYRNTLSTLFPPHIHGHLRTFLSVSLALQEAMPVADFSRLSGISEPTTDEIHQRLAALQTQGDPQSNLVSPVMRRFHASFVEFITTNTNDETLKAINPAEAHSTLAKRCLDILFVNFLPSFRGRTCIYSDLRGLELYTVKFWPLHVFSGTSSQILGDGRDLDVISEEGMHRWASLFLPCIAARFRENHTHSFGGIHKSVLLYEMANVIGEEDPTTLPYYIQCLNIAIQLQPSDLRIRKALAFAYHRLYEQSLSSGDLDQEINAFRSAREQVSHTDYSMLVNNLANALRIRFERRGAPDDLDEAISLHEETLLLPPGGPGQPDRSIALNNLAIALETRFAQRGVLDDLDKAINFHREALLRRPEPNPDRFSSLINLATSLTNHFKERGDAKELDEAISLYRAALFLLPSPHPDRSSSLNNLASALQTRFEQWGDPKDIDEAIVLHKEALLLQPSSRSDRSMSLNNLATALQNQFGVSEQGGDPKVLDTAISLHREALLLRPAPHPDRSMSLNNIAIALQTRFEIQQGTQQDLDEATSFLQEALLLQATSHPLRSMSLSNLAVVLQTRFEHVGSSSPHDLDEAIVLYREALFLRPVPHPDHAVSLSNLANALQLSFKLNGNSKILDEAILLHRQALLHCPPQHVLYPFVLKGLIGALQLQIERSHCLVDVVETISLYERLLDCPALEDSERPSTLEQLQAATKQRDDLVRNQSDSAERMRSETAESN